MSDQSTPVTRLPLRKGASLRWLPFLFIFLQSVLYGLCLLYTSDAADE